MLYITSKKRQFIVELKKQFKKKTNYKNKIKIKKNAILL